MVLPIESADSFFENRLKIPDRFKRYLIPSADHHFT